VGKPAHRRRRRPDPGKEDPVGVLRTNRRAFLRSSLIAAGWAPFSGIRPTFGEDLRIDATISRLAGEAELSMLFRGTTAAECRAWQEEFRSTLGRLLGETTPPKEWTVEEESRRQLQDHVRHELLLKAAGVATLPLYLLVPADQRSRRKRPAVVCIHGHGPYGHHPVVGRTDFDDPDMTEGVREHIERAHYDYGLQFVRRGYVVVAPCLIPFGRRLDPELYGDEDPCAVTFVRMQALGKLPIAANLRDLRWCLDFLETRPEVDRDRIGCAGLSYGGRMTMLVSAMDERIKVAAVSGALNLLQERITNRYSCGSQIIPGLLEYGDFSEIGSLIAPRPCVWEVGSTDSLIVDEWDAVFRERLERAYRALDASEDLHFDEFVGGHRWSGCVAYPLFERVLWNIQSEDLTLKWQSESQNAIACSILPAS
jgi:dienelactone hydrolase